MTNGNYVVRSGNWNNAATSNAGACGAMRIGYCAAFDKLRGHLEQRRVFGDTYHMESSLVTGAGTRIHARAFGSPDDAWWHRQCGPPHPYVMRAAQKRFRYAVGWVSNLRRK